MFAHFFPHLEALLGWKLRLADQRRVCQIVEDLAVEITALINKFIPKEAELVFPQEYFAESFRQAYPKLLEWLDSERKWCDLPRLNISNHRKLPKSHLEGIVGTVLFATVDELLRTMNKVMAHTFDSMTYLGPLRFYPERHYAFSEKGSDWYSTGADAWEQITSSGMILDGVNKWLKRLETGYQVRLRTWSTKRMGQDPAESRRELALLDTRSATIVSHRDIGTGISQMLPILATACGSNDQIHAIEQPEIHVHPALQAHLGDLFIESALGAQKNTFLIETHSEHLILRILRRIRETSSGKNGGIPINPEDVSVIYVAPGKTGSKVTQLPITPDGDFGVPWPGGFFSERFQDLPL
jgi:hypothetical protein